MASVTFYNFSKRKNSTAQPSGGTSHTVRLKDGTSLYNPTFQLSGGNFPNYTYASWQGLYFYVTNITSVANNLYDIECELDPIASAKSAILSTTAFVNRTSNSAYWDIWLKDVEMSARQKIKAQGSATTSLSTLFDGTGCYILRVTGNDPNCTGIATYAVTESELRALLDFMFTDSNFVDVLNDVVIKAVFNPFQYIVSLKYTPIAKSVFDAWGSTSQVNFGWWNGPSTLVRIIDRCGGVFNNPSPITIPSVTSYGDFRDYDPEFTEVKLLLPGGNNVTIPSIWLSENMYINGVFDIFTGEAVLLLQNSSAILASFPFKCAAEIQIGQVAANVGGIMGDAAGAIGSFISGNPIGTGISAAGAVANVLQPSPSILSQSSSMQAMKTYRDPQLSIIRYDSSLAYPAQLGRMCNQNITLSNLSGYYAKCSGAHVVTNLPQEYKNIIDDTLNSGIFLD